MLAYDRLWSTDSVWYGSPQWQIEACRQLEIPEEMQEKYGFSPLLPADGPEKNDILCCNSSRMYKLDLNPELKPLRHDGLAAMKTTYLESGPGRSNLAYGYVKPT